MGARWRNSVLALRQAQGEQFQSSTGVELRRSVTRRLLDARRQIMTFAGAVSIRSLLAAMTAVLVLGCAPQRSEPSATTQADPSVAQRAQRVLHIVVRDEPNML